MQLARANIRKSAEYNREHYNKKAKAVELNVGDQVLMRNVRERGGTGKLRSFWEETVFEVVEKRDNVPVFRIRNIKDGRDSRVVHRNLLMKVEQLPLDVFDKPDDQPSRPTARPTRGKKPEKKSKGDQGKCPGATEELNQSQPDEGSEDEGHDVIIYEETLPELVDLVPREMGVSVDSSRDTGLMESEDLDTVDSDIAEPVISVPDSDDPEIIEPEVHDENVGSEREDPEVVDTTDQENEEPLDVSLGHEESRDQSFLENEAFDTAESSLEENSEEEDSAEECEEPPGRRTARARVPKKIFSYDSKGQPYWEET